MAIEDITPKPGIDRDDDDLMEREGGDRGETDQADDAGIGADEDDDEFDDNDEDVDDDEEDSDIDE